MLKIILGISFFISILSCGSNEKTVDENENSNSDLKESKKMGTSKNKNFGEWEQDSDGNKFREDYELKQQLSGSELVKYTRTDGGQYGGSSSTTKFTLCSDGSLRYYHQSLTTISVEGAGGSDGSQDSDEGTWRAIENEKGLKILEMKSTKHGNTGYMEIRPQGNKIHMVWYNEWQEFLIKKVGC